MGGAPVGEVVPNEFRGLSSKGALGIHPPRLARDGSFDFSWILRTSKRSEQVYEQPLTLMPPGVVAMLLGYEALLTSKPWSLSF